MRPNPIRQLSANGKPALNCRITLPGTSAEYAKEMIATGFDFVTVISDENLLARGAAERTKLNA